MPAYATTGDGVLTGLHLMARMAATGQVAGRPGRRWCTRLPQVLINVPVGRPRRRRRGARRCWPRSSAAEAELGETGRVLLRPSGTEPLVRVMVEAATADIAQDVAERIADVVRAASPARVNA